MVSSRHWDRSPSERRLNDRGSAGQCWAFEKALRSEEEKPHQDMNLQQVKEVYICIYIYTYTLYYTYIVLYTISYIINLTRSGEPWKAQPPKNTSRGI